MIIKLFMHTVILNFAIMVMRAYSIAKPAKRIWPLQLRKSINVTLFGY